MKIYKNFISFEGIDFSGKSTQIKILLERLNSHKINPLIVREPGGTQISEKIRELLLSPSHSEMVERSEILLYEAARAQLVHEVLLPQLEQGRFVIADRFYDSTTAYQGSGRNLPRKFVLELNRFATSELKPYRTLFIDITPEMAEQRQIEKKHAQDRLEGGGLEFFNKTREGYLQLCNEEPERFIKIDGMRKTEEIARDIWKVVSEIWNLED
jgi:dTMP kinase